MKIRLKITAGGQVTTFEHPGPVVRIGRDPTCELHLEGEASTAVSRQHAQIKLTGDGAVLSDAGSSNGTLLNDRLLDGGAPVRVGDRIQLGYTGAMLQVLALDLAPSPGPGVPMVMKAAAVGGGVLTLALLLMAFVLTRPKPGGEVPSDGKEKGAAGNEKQINPPPLAQVFELPLPTFKELAQIVPRTELKPVGEYVERPNTLNLLLARDTETASWRRLLSGDNVFPGQPLVSLPGYESAVDLQNGAVRLILWGNLPPFSGSPVRESAVTLHPLDPGIDADLTLERGRIHLSSGKNRSMKVRLRFLYEALDLTLADGSQAWAELHPPRPVVAGPGRIAYQDSHLLVFTFGKAEVVAARVGKRFYSNGPSVILWSAGSKTITCRPLQELPAWLTAAPDTRDLLVAATAVALVSWGERLPRGTGAANLAHDITKAVEDPKEDHVQRLLGLLFLAALDEPAPLVRALEDTSELWDIRSTATEGLLAWLGREYNGTSRLRDMFSARGYSGEEAGQVMQLLRLGQSDLAALVRHLDHPKPAVRHLAGWHLYFALALTGRIPKEALTIRYHPLAAPAERAEAVRRWQEILKVKGQRGVSMSWPLPVIEQQVRSQLPVRRQGPMRQAVSAAAGRAVSQREPHVRA